jgi:hypothetical protein
MSVLLPSALFLPTLLASAPILLSALLLSPLFISCLFFSCPLFSRFPVCSSTVSSFHILSVLFLCTLLQSVLFPAALLIPAAFLLSFLTCYSHPPCSHLPIFKFIPFLSVPVLITPLPVVSVSTILALHLILYSQSEIFMAKETMQPRNFCWPQHLHIQNSFHPPQGNNLASDLNVVSPFFQPDVALLNRIF